MEKQVDVAIIGAGSAGLSALKEVQKKTKSYVVINDGPYGTTCARVGCMPSKLLIQVAEDYHRREALGGLGIHGGEGLSVQLPEVMRYVRKWRDYFVDSVKEGMEAAKDHHIAGRARFVGPTALQVGKQTIHAKRVIIATGTRPIIPEAWKRFGDRILTTDQLFEQDSFPRRMAVVGLGAIGVEMGQALSRLGVELTGFAKSKKIAGLSDVTVSDRAVEVLTRELPMVLGTEVKLEESAGGIEVIAGAKRCLVDGVLASLGRAPNLEELGLENTGVERDAKGVPLFNPLTMRVKGVAPIYIAGDVDGHRPVLHEASDDGRIAGFNSVRESDFCFQRRARMVVTFSDPNIAAVGERYREGLAVGEIDFASQGRSRILGKNAGLLRIYADPKSGKLMGAEMIAPRGEHLAHLLAWSIQWGHSVYDLLKQPFYHPVVEEGLRTALRDLARHIETNEPHPELALCDESPVEGLY